MFIMYLCTELLYILTAIFKGDILGAIKFVENQFTVRTQ